MLQNNIDLNKTEGGNIALLILVLNPITAL
jgi:hypothetical protein